jgi:hypothetical protein
LTPFCGLFCDEINWSSEMHRRLYGSAVMLLQFVVPLAIITFVSVTYTIVFILIRPSPPIILEILEFDQKEDVDKKKVKYSVLQTYSRIAMVKKID